MTGEALMRLLEYVIPAGQKIGRQFNGMGRASPFAPGYSGQLCGKERQDGFRKTMLDSGEVWDIRARFEADGVARELPAKAMNSLEGASIGDVQFAACH
jgi:hypothetical protein